MQERHLNRKHYFLEQGKTTRQFVIPYIQEVCPIGHTTRVLEIGCGEGGNLIPFIELGCRVLGIDISEKKINHARQFTEEVLPGSKPEFICQDIYTVDPGETGLFDLVIMRDVIEHIPHQDHFIAHLKSFLSPGGRVFFGFPPWHMPFGGHQQMCRSRVLSKMPYFHLFPNFIYKAILRVFGEKEGTIKALLDTKSTGIGISKFENILSRQGYVFDRKTLWFINPNYQTKFGLKPRKQWPLIGAIPLLRDFVTTCYYCVVRSS